jgi:hypothetical protein
MRLLDVARPLISRSTAVCCSTRAFDGLHCCTMTRDLDTDAAAAAAAASLTAVGVTNATDLVTAVGPARCRQVLTWALRRQQLQHVHNLPALIASRCMTGFRKIPRKRP